MTLTTSYTQESVPVDGTELYLLKGGNGQPCVFLHDIEGHEGWLKFHSEISASSTVIAPSHPGFGQTPAPEWITGVQHQAVFYNWFLQEAGLQNVDLVGVGLGGWIAAEMAVMDSSRLRHLVLVGPAGLRPRHGEILDIFLLPWRQVIERGFLQVNGQHSGEFERIYTANPIQEFGGVREAGRTMTMRMCFKPYMHDPSLAGMLPKISLPTLVVWGEDDDIIPVECGRLFQELIPDAQLRAIPSCGHFVHLDQPEQLATIVREFCAS
jgi:pimeloyl-ACP methyl ester carboxylesterase